MMKEALGLPDWRKQPDKIHLLHPLFPRIICATGGDDDGRLEEVLEYLWRVLLEKRGPSEAARLTEYICDISQHKGWLHVYWTCPFAMRLLKPAVKYAWGVLDVAVMMSYIEITHHWSGGQISDYYSENDIEYFSDNFNCQAPFPPSPSPPIAA